MFKIENCGKSYKKKQVFQNLNYEFANDIYWILGENGVGKSVFCRCLVGLEKFTEGKVNGDLGKVLYLPDTALGENWMTMDENFKLMLYYYGISLSEERRSEIKDMLGITYEDDLASQVSVGTAMKVGLSLLFVEDYWNTIVLDETLSHIDIKTKDIIISELEKRKNEGATVFLINHGELCTSDLDISVQKLHLKKDSLHN